MKETKQNSLEYLSKVYKGLSAEKKDYVLDTARSLLRIQDGNNYPVNGKTVFQRKRERFTVLEPLSAYADKKI
jgi:hypothetical protein